MAISGLRGQLKLLVLTVEALDACDSVEMPKSAPYASLEEGHSVVEARSRWPYTAAAYGSRDRQMRKRRPRCSGYRITRLGGGYGQVLQQLRCCQALPAEYDTLVGFESEIDPRSA